VALGAVARGGLTRGDQRACAHDLGGHEQYRPWGIVEEDRARRRLTFGRSVKPSDVIVEPREAWGATVEETAQAARPRLQRTRENGPASSGKRTQCLHRMVQCAAQMGTPIHRLYDPPSQSKSNPMERCWGLWERHWNGTKLGDGKPRLEGAKRMTWQGRQPIGALSRQVDQKGMALSHKARQAIESRLERHPAWPTWDMLLRPASAR
jgi:Rhodopirellula transposase DDE domain